MDKLGFDTKREFLPSFDKFQNDVNKRRMFLKLFNQEVSSNLRFSKDEIAFSSKNSLCEIFINKVLRNLQFDTYVKTSLKVLDVKRSNKFNSFLKKANTITGKRYPSFSIINSYEEGDLQKAEALTDLLENNNFSFYLDPQKIFKNFVSNKILKVNRNKKVKIHQDSIDIDSKEYMQKTKIYTFWQFLDSNNLKIDEHIQKAVECIKNTEFNQVYLVYPKNENFNRHIKINCDNQLNDKEYEIKVIPYSLRSTLR